MPARKPRAVKVLSGTLRADREPRKPATPRKGRAHPPTWLPRAERAAFRQLVTQTERTGTPTRSFGHVLTAAAVAWAQLERLTGVLTTQGETYETVSTTGARKIVVRPEAQLRNTALRLLKPYLVELGLTPASIGRVDQAAISAEMGPERAARAGRFFLMGGRAPADSTEAFLFRPGRGGGGVG